MPPIGSIFLNNTTQAVRLPAEARFPDHVKKVEIRVVGNTRILTPAGSGWESFFASLSWEDDEPLFERGPQIASERGDLI